MGYLGEVNETLEQLILLIGKDNARKVFDFFEGENIYFPKRIGLAELQEQIYADLRDGMNYSTVAKKYGYSKSYIRKIEKKVLTKRRALHKAGMLLPAVPQVDNAEPVKVTAFTTPQEIATKHIKPMQQGELFHGL